MHFPEYFHSFYASHMYLISIDENTYECVPPNQCDWKYTIERIHETSWKVYGEKDNQLDPLQSFETYNMIFVKYDKEGCWRSSE